MGELNLAARPFLNPRPVWRVSLLLWVLGIAVAAFNVRLYLSHYSGSSSDRAREQELEASLEGERAKVDDLRTELEGYDVEWQNEQAVFFNAKIAERSFPWSELFDRLGETMPADVRLNTLSPSFGEGRGSRAQIAVGEALLVIRGQAKNSEVVLEFIDALFAHPKFRAPDLSSESLQESGLLDFGLSVIYRAGTPGSAAPVGASVDVAEPQEAVEAGGSEAETPDQPAPSAPAEEVSE